MKKSAIITIISLILLVLIGGGVVWHLKSQKNQPKQPPVTENNNPEQQQNNGLQGETATTSTESVDMSNWLYFNSKKDTEMNIRVSFQYPNFWIHKGSIDGGAVSSVPFFDKNKYSEDCTKINNSERCIVKGQTAYFSVSNKTGSTPYSNTGTNGQEVVVAGYKGVVSKNNSKLGVKDMEYIGGSKLQLILSDVNGNTIQFLMVLQTKEDEAIFKKILETIKF